MIFNDESDVHVVPSIGMVEIGSKKAMHKKLFFFPISSSFGQL